MNKIIVQITEENVQAMIDTLNKMDGGEFSIKFTPKTFPEYELKVTLTRKEIEEEEMEEEDE